MITTLELSKRLGLKHDTVTNYVGGNGRGKLADYLHEQAELNPVGFGVLRYWSNGQVEKAVLLRDYKAISCEWCNKEFTPKRETQKYCGTKCRQRKAWSLQENTPKLPLKKPLNLAPKLSDYRTGIQTSSAPKCKCNRGTVNPYTGMCSSCVVEGRHSTKKCSIRMKGI